MEPESKVDDLPDSLEPVEILSEHFEMMVPKIVVEDGKVPISLTELVVEDKDNIE